MRGLVNRGLSSYSPCCATIIPPFPIAQSGSGLPRRSKGLQIPRKPWMWLPYIPFKRLKCFLKANQRNMPGSLLIKARCAIFLCGKEVFSEKQDLVSHTVGNLICIHQFEKYLGNRSLKFHARTNKRNAVQVPISTCYEICKQGTVRPGCCFLQYGFKGLLERQERENGLGTRVMFQDLMQYHS